MLWQSKMPDFTDQSYLKNDQYRDSSNLDARVYLHDRFSTNPQGWFTWMIETLEELPKTGKVLDLGCGSGNLWRHWAGSIPAGWSITLADLSDGMLLAAWRNLVVTGRAFKYEKMDAQEIPYQDQTFDVVIANHMLYHVPDRARALREIWRVLKPGGRLVASTVGQNHMQELEVWLAQVSRAENYVPFRNAFTLESGQVELENMFADVSIRRYADSLRITEIEPLIAYMRSSIKASELSEIELTKLSDILAAELRSGQAIIVGKDSGLFLATRKEDSRTGDHI
jgi:ubiquinone/menaquinone biosynthesis C-methylase UbiE